MLAVPACEGKLSADQINKVMEAHFAEDGPEHMVQPAMVYISFPTELGTIYTKQELSAIRSACDEWQLNLFIDGARLGYGLTCDACDVNLKGIAAIADVFYIGGTKQGALLGEAVVINNDALKKDFRYNIKQNGGMLAKGRLLGLQFEALFEDNLYFDAARHANVLAKKVRAAFEAKGCEFLIDSPTNQQFPILSKEDVDRLEESFVFSRWQIMDDGRIATRFCTSWATTEEAVDRLVALL